MQKPLAVGSKHGKWGVKKEAQCDGFKRWRRTQFEMRHKKKWRPGSAGF